MVLDLLPESVRPFAKAVMAALTPVICAVVYSAITGEWDRAGIAGLIVGALTALLVYKTPNEPQV